MKMSFMVSKKLVIVVALLSFNFLFGCAGREFAPKKDILYYHKELPAAERAVADAQKAGKDKKCPIEFNAVKDMKDKAYETYWACRTDEAICIARNAIRNAKALCPSKNKPFPVKEECAVIDRMTIKVNFDFDKSEIREADEAQLKKAVNFVRKYRGANIRLEGFTDSIGTEEYNKALSERRANAVKNYLVKEGGIGEKEIKAVGYGESNPVASNKTEAGRAENRRVEILIMSK
jgi:outer membrane protein OmpA-like peptidoglycan-associated protein